MGQALVDLKITSNRLHLGQNPQVEYRLHKILKKFERLKRSLAKTFISYIIAKIKLGTTYNFSVLKNNNKDITLQELFL